MAEVRAYVLEMAQAVDAYRSYQFPAARSKKTTNGLVNPPLDLVKLASFYDESTWHRNAVRVKARDLVGHGWLLDPEFEEGADPPVPTRSGWTLSSGTAAWTASPSFVEHGAVAFFWNGGVEGRAGRPGAPVFVAERSAGARPD